MSNLIDLCVCVCVKIRINENLIEKGLKPFVVQSDKKELTFRFKYW